MIVNNEILVTWFNISTLNGRSIKKDKKFYRGYSNEIYVSDTYLEYG